MMLKKAWIIVVLLAVLTGCSCSGDKEGGEPVAQYQSIDTVPMLIMQIQQCSRLYTTEIHVHKIVTHDDVVSLKGTLLKQDIDIKLPLGDRKIAIPMDATLKAYIDFSNFGPSNIERQGDKITIVLPDPKVEMTSSKINQQAIREYVGIARSHFSDAEMSSYEQQGRQAIIKSIPKMGIMETARRSAANTLIPLISSMGFDEKNITITFRKEFSTNEISKLITMPETEKSR
jgi:hypothetical protein